MKINPVRNYNFKNSTFQKPLVIYNESGTKPIYQEFYDGSFEEYFGDGTLSRRVEDDGREVRFYNRKQKSYESLPSGVWKSYHPNGNLFMQELKDGTFERYNQNGDIEFVLYPNGYEIEYLDDVGLVFQRDKDGLWKYSYQDSNATAAEILSNKTKRFYRPDGSIKLILKPEDKLYHNDTIDLIFA